MRTKNLSAVEYTPLFNLCDHVVHSDVYRLLIFLSKTKNKQKDVAL